VQALSLPDPFDGARLLRSVRHERYFLVPLDAPLPAGTFRVRDENGKLETLKLGKLAHWEIMEESAVLILEHRAAAAGANAAQVLNTLFSALNISGASLEQALESLAKAASTKPEHQAEVQKRIRAQLRNATNPQERKSLTGLSEALKAKT
jgi:hypothetical protein